MSRGFNSSRWSDEPVAHCQHSCRKQSDEAEFVDETANSRATLTSYHAAVDWMIQFGQSAVSYIRSQVNNEPEAGRGSFPRFLCFARTLLCEEKFSAFRPVEWFRDRLLRILRADSHRLSSDSPLPQAKHEGELTQHRRVGLQEGKATRTKRSKDQSELPVHLVTGSRGEQLALDYLRQMGWKLIDRNVRALGGEIDLVMLDQGTIVFVEVKTWGSATDEDPAEAVDLYKQRTLTRAGLAFLRKKRWLERPARFDVVSVRMSERGSVASGEERGPTLRHFRSAFESQGDSFFG
jgi:putative endonuclease